MPEDELIQGSFKKFFAVFLAIIIVALAGFFFVRYRQILADKQKEIDAVQQAENARQALYQQELADTYGGKTPQDTLRMYIDAVEKGDYVLASKYFVIEKQGQWLNEMDNINEQNKIDNFLEPVKTALYSDGEYSSDQKSYSIYNPVGVDFTLYPSGFWKISNI